MTCGCDVSSGDASAAYGAGDVCVVGDRVRACGAYSRVFFFFCICVRATGEAEGREDDVKR